MAKSLDDVEVRLPSQFLTAQDMLGDKENNKNDGNADIDAAFCFPSEFPFEFDSFGVNSALSSPVESVAGSTETEASDEEDFLAGLTRRLSQSSIYETGRLTVPISTTDKAESQKTWGLPRSPQSTLSGIGSWSGRSAVSGDGSPNGPSQVPSPTATPFSANNDTWDVIYAAAGQVARLKINDEFSKYDLQNRGLLGHSRAPVPFNAAKNPTAALFPNRSFTHTLNHASQVQHQQQVRQEQLLKQQCASIWGRQAKANWLAQQQQQIQTRGRNLGYESAKCGRNVSLPQSAWHPLRVQHQNQQVQHHGSGSRAGTHGGSGAKRGCGGTGVFLPRQYGNPPESRKKTCCAPVLVPPKAVHALNFNLDDLNATAQQRFAGAITSDYEALLARRNAVLMQQRVSVLPEEAVNHELRLPQEWAY